MATSPPLSEDTADQPKRSVDFEATMRSSSRRAMQLLALLILVFFVSMVLIPIGGAVVASGQVGVESRIKRIAHPSGGVIADIYVSNGDQVKEGDPLLRFDDNVSGTTSELSSLTVSQMLAQRARLDAERLGHSSLSFPPELLNSTEPGAREAMVDEGRLFVTRRNEQAQLRAQLAARVTQYRREISGYNAQITALRKQQELIGPERAGVRELWDQNLVTISRLNQLERTAADIEGSIAALQAQIARAQARISETNEQMIQLAETRRAEAGAQLSQINNVLNEQQVRSVTAEDTQRRTLVRAPYDGVVDKLAFNTIGDVIRPAETIMEIVPDRDRLLVEVAVSPADIDRVASGQEARIRFTAFSSTASPEIAGEVIHVAPERTDNPETGASFYAARVAVNAAELRANPEIVLRAGMPAEVFIQTGSRPMISYITKPLQDQFARAFRDN
jgi:HlyD family secretion protein